MYSSHVPSAIHTPPPFTIRRCPLAFDADTTDAALVQGLLRDHSGAWHEFNRRYGGLMFRTISRVLNRFSSVTSEDDAHEGLRPRWVRS